MAGSDDEGTAESGRVVQGIQDFLRGRSHDTVLSALALLALAWADLAVWRVTGLAQLQLAGIVLGALLFICGGLGLVLMINLHTGRREPGDTLTAGIILALGGVVAASIGIWLALAWAVAAATGIGGVGVILLLRGMGLLPQSQLSLGISMALGGGAILSLAVLQPEAVWMLLPLLLLGLGMAGLHHRRYQLAGFVLGCYLAGLGCLGWLVSPEVAAGGLLAGGRVQSGR